jgi:hypothetical protein
VAEVKRTAEGAPSMDADEVAGGLYSELITKHFRCIKYKSKNLKSREVPEVVSSVDVSFLREL